MCPQFEQKQKMMFFEDLWVNVPDTDGRGLKDKVLQETSSVLLPIGVEMFHNMIKMITQKNFVEICRSP